MGNLKFIKSASGTSVSSLEVTNTFSANYDVYKIVAKDIDTTVEDWIYFRFIDSVGSPVTAGNYDYASLYLRSWTTFSEQRGTNNGFFPRWTVQDTGSEDNGGVVTYVFNPYSSSSYTYLINQASFNTSLGQAGLKGIVVLKQSATMTGFQIYPNSGTFDNVSLSVYGVK